MTTQHTLTRLVKIVSGGTHNKRLLHGPHLPMLTAWFHVNSWFWADRSLIWIHPDTTDTKALAGQFCYLFEKYTDKHCNSLFIQLLNSHLNVKNKLKLIYR